MSRVLFVIVVLLQEFGQILVDYFSLAFAQLGFGNTVLLVECNFSSMLARFGLELFDQIMSTAGPQCLVQVLHLGS